MLTRMEYALDTLRFQIDYIRQNPRVLGRPAVGALAFVTSCAGPGGTPAPQMEKCVIEITQAPSVLGPDVRVTNNGTVYTTEIPPNSDPFRSAANSAIHWGSLPPGTLIGGEDGNNAPTCTPIDGQSAVYPHGASAGSADALEARAAMAAAGEGIDLSFPEG